MNWLKDQRLLTIVTVTALFGVLGFVGSAYSVGAAGAMLFAAATFFLIPSRRNILPLPVLLFSAAGALYFVSGLAIALNNFNEREAWNIVLQRTPFLFIAPLFAQTLILNRSQLMDCLIRGMLISGLGIGLWIGYDLYFGNNRLSGGAGNPGPYATICAFVMSLAYIAALYEKRHWYSKFIVLAGLLAAFGLLASLMRLMYPLLLIIPILVFLTNRKRVSEIVSKRAVLVLILAILAVAILSSSFWLPRINEFFISIERYGLSASANWSIGSRITIWTCALQGIPQAPIFGWGPEGALEHLRSCTTLLVGDTFNHTHYHNFMLSSLMVGGAFDLIAVSLLVFVLPVYATFHLMTKKTEPIQRLALTGILLVSLILLTQGVANLMLGHDIHDFLFAHANTVLLATFFASPGIISKEEEV